MDDSTVTRSGVSVIPGTPTQALGESALVLKLWRTLRKPTDAVPGKASRSHAMASVHVVKPDRAGYIIKPLVQATEMVPDSALAAVIAAAQLVGLSKVYVNANLERLPLSPSVTANQPISGSCSRHDEHIQFSLALS